MKTRYIKNILLYARLVFIIVLLMCGMIEAKKVKTTFKTPSSTQTEKKGVSKRIPEALDSVELAAIIPQIELSGYDKTAQSAKESFLLTNNSEHNIAGMVIELTYTDLQGRMIHKREETVKYNVPQGETRMISIRTFDEQKTLYYKNSTPPRSGGMPFNVDIKITSVSCYK